MRSLNRLMLLFFLSLFIFGFRLGWKNVMNASKSSPKLYVKICDSIKTSTFSENSVGSGDELYQMENIDTVDVMYSIAKDYKDIGGSYLDVVIYGDTDEDGDIDGSDDSSHQTIPEDKIVEFCTGGTGGLLAGGVAKINPDGGCTIELSDSVFDDVKAFLRTTTHELGHCFGLDHAHEMNELSIMSYFASDDTYRLQIDDKLGISYLYPNSGAKEKSTYGLRCKAKD